MAQGVELMVKLTGSSFFDSFPSFCSGDFKNMEKVCGDSGPQGFAFEIAVAILGLESLGHKAAQVSQHILAFITLIALFRLRKLVVVHRK